MPVTNVANIERIAAEVARLYEKLGVIRAALRMIQAGVDVSRILEGLDRVQPADNAALRRKPSVRMEGALHRYQQEERETEAAARAAMSLLIKRNQ